VIVDPCDYSDPNTDNETWITCDVCVCECFPVEGCTDINACNFNVDANMEDGSGVQIGDRCEDGLIFTSNFNSKDLVSSIFPIPCDGQNMSIQINNLCDEKQLMNLNLYSVMGEQIWSDQLEVSGPLLTHEINFKSTLVSGVYVVKIRVGNNSILHKINIYK